MTLCYRADLYGKSLCWAVIDKHKPSLLCRELDAIEDHSKRLELLLRGVFAGNVFDLGAASSVDLFRSKGVSSWAPCFKHSVT